MPLRRSHPRKRAAPDAVVDVGSALGEPQHDPAQIGRDLEIERLREENRRLREEIVRGKSQASSATSLVPVAPVPERIVRMRQDEEGISLQDFLRLKTPEFRGEREEDPKEFLEETEKVIKRLPCFDVKAIELVGMVMKENA